MKICRKMRRAWKRGKPAYMRIVQGKSQRALNYKKGSVISAAKKHANQSIARFSKAAVAAGLALNILASPVAFAMPSGGTISAGQGSISQTGSNMTVQQNTNKLAVNWQSFGIGQAEKVQFIQPNAQSVALNRVIGNDASRIYGQLSANGKVFLINPNGVLFAPGSQVSVGGIVASSLQLSDKDFLNGKYVFSKNGTAGAVSNQGNIETADGGYAAFIGSKAANEGVVLANKGSIGLAAGEQVTLDFTGDGLINLSVNQAAVDAQVSNSNLLEAKGGMVVMTAKAAGTLTDAVLNNTGVIKAQGMSSKNGKIILDGGTNGTVSVSGTLDASGQKAGEAGGTVKVLGNNVALAGKVDVSGDVGGGTALIGGAYQGGSSELSANTTTVAANAAIKADALTSGNGGQVVVWANDTTSFAGSISAKGSSSGGSVETSGKKTLKVADTASVNTTAANGKNGSWLLDPTNFTIANTGGDITPTTLQNALANNDVSISTGTKSNVGGVTDVTTGALNSGTDGDIYVNSSISWNSDHTLSLSAVRDILINSSITPGTGTRSGLSLDAGRDIHSSTGGSLLNSNGALSLTAKQDLIIEGAITNNSITVPALSAGRDIQIKNNITYTGGSGSPFIIRADNDYNNIGTVTIDSGKKITSPSNSAVKIYYINSNASGVDYTHPTDYSANIINKDSSNNPVWDAYMLVNDLAHLQQMNTNLTGTYAMLRSIDAAETASLNSGAGFLPIGDSTHPFKGKLSGILGTDTSKTYSIDYLKINRPTTDNVGLFGVTDGAKLYYVQLQSSNIIGQNNVGSIIGMAKNNTELNKVTAQYITVKGNTAIGGLVGKSDHSKIDTASVSSYYLDSVTGQTSIGGLIGEASNSTIKTGTNSAMVTGRSDNTGGLIGKSSQSTITGSSNSASIIGKNNVGGLIGSADTTSSIETSSNSGEITGVTNTGGLVGTSDASTIKDSYNTGKVIGTGDNTGGLAGMIANHSVIINSDGDQNYTYNNGIVRGQNYTGGLAGRSDQSTITLAYNNGAVTGNGYVGGAAGKIMNSTIEKTFNQAAVNGGTQVGGLVGSSNDLGSGGTAGETKISEDYNNGVVTATGQYIGGLLGYAGTNNKITDSYNTGAVSGTVAVGGLVGLNGGSIATSINSGKVTGLTDSDKTGGLVAEGSPAASSSYWDQTLSGQSTSVGGTPLADSAAARIHTNYGGLDFTNKWYIVDNYTRPILRSEHRISIINAHQLQLVDLNLRPNYTLSRVDLKELTDPNGLWNPDTGFVPIGTTTTFTKNFDGKGIPITGLKINRIDQDNVGFFGSTNGATINNVRLSNANITGKNNVGGLIGNQTGGTLTYSSSTGSVSGVKSVGGLVGNLSSGGTIVGSNNTAAVQGNQNTGGLVGNMQNGTITRYPIPNTSPVKYAYSNNTGTVNGVDILAPTSPILANSTGGLVGNFVNGEVEYAYNIADVTGKQYTGGLVGNMYSGGKIEKAYSLGVVTGTAYTGGAVGGAASGSTLNQVFQAGLITGTTQSGGLVGAGHPTVTDSFWDNAASGQTSSAAGTGKSTVEMMKKDTYSNWNFSNDWNINFEVSYPYLKDQSISLISGTLSGTGSTAGSAAGKTVQIAVNGNLYKKATTGASGFYYSLSSDSSIFGYVVSYISNDADIKGADVRGYTSGNITGMDIKKNAVTVSGNTSNYDMYSAKGTLTTTDIPYSISANTTSYPYVYTLSVADGFDFQTLSGSTYTPSKSVTTTGSQTYNGIVNLSGDTTLTATGDITLSTVNGYSYHLKAKAANEIILKGKLTSSAVGDAIVLEGQKFDNQKGSDALAVTGSGRWLVYSADPANDTRGSLSYAFKQYNTTNGQTILGAGNGFVYSIAPTLQVSLTNPLSKTYDGSPLSQLVNSDFGVSGALTGDSATVTGTVDFGNKNAGVSKPVNLDTTVTVKDGAALVYGYTIDKTQLPAVGTITPKSVSAVVSGSISKPYDGNTTADLGASYNIPNKVNGDDLTLTAATGIYDDKKAGARTAIFSGLALAGADQDNYSLSTTTLSSAGLITAKTLTVSLQDAVTKGYDATTAINNLTAANYKMEGIIGSDVVLLNKPANGTYDNKNVGTGKQVTVTGLSLSGADAANYQVAASASGNIGQIDQATLTVSLTDKAGKTYNGTTTATLADKNYQVSGRFDHDVVTLNNSTSGTYDDKNVGTNKLVTVTGLDLAGTDAGNYKLAATTVSGNIGQIDKATLTVGLTGTVGKVYNANTTAGLAANNYVSDKVSGDDVRLNNPTSGTYDNKNVGTGKAVTVNGLAIAGGSDAGNYQLAATTVRGNVGQIDKATLTAGLTGTVGKVYDGNTTASLLSGNYTLDGVMSGDKVTMSKPSSGIYDNKKAGSSKTVTVTGIGISGEDAGNYQVSNSVSGAVGQIDKAGLTAGLTGTAVKVYNGNTTASLASENYTLSGVVTGDKVALNNPSSGTYDTKTVGTAKTVTVNGIDISGEDASNYQIASRVSGAIGQVDKATLTAGLKGTVGKVYDGTTAASLTGENYTLSGVVTGDTVALNNPSSGTYDTKRAGSNKTVAVTGLGISGEDAGNYQISPSVSGSVGQITKATLTADLTGTVEKVYDGKTNASLTSANYTINGMVKGDEVAVINYESGIYDNKKAGSAKTVTVTGLGIKGADAENYQLSATTLSKAVGQVDKAILTAGLTGEVVKVEDGSTTAFMNAGNYTLSGVVAGDTVSLSNTERGNYDTKTVGTGKTVTVDALGLAGADADNYQLSSTTLKGEIGQITPMNIIKPTAAPAVQESQPKIVVEQGGVAAPANPASPQVPASVRVTSAGGNNSYTVETSGNALTIKFGDANSAPIVNRTVAVVTVGSSGAQSSTNYNLASGSGSMTITAGAAASSPTAGEPSAAAPASTFSMTTATGAVAEFKVLYENGAVSIKPLNDSAQTLVSTSGDSQKLVAATGMLTAQQNLGVDLQAVEAVYMHE